MSEPKRKYTAQRARQPANKALQSRRRNRAATEVALVAAAAAIFAERGYEASTTKAIAERAGYSEALIQVYFKGKEGLLLAVINREEARSPDETAFFERPLCADFETEARETFGFVAGMVTKHLTRLRIAISRALIDPEFWPDQDGPSVRGFLRANLRGRFERYVEAKRLPSDFDAARATEMLLALGFTLGFLDREVFRADATERNHRLAAYAAVFGQGIVPLHRKEEGEG